MTNPIGITQERPGDVECLERPCCGLCRRKQQEEVRDSSIFLEQSSVSRPVRSSRGRIRVQPFDGRSYNSMQ
ncbi:hypothetical protein Golax_008806 [Gossypium laxum]|uniref:Uncharacterized protein n=1 Tax=Gossypium laxum TaxID=34288 RepID=A0A7J9AB01_9ROSI|nr:hypothetical protein [Gossypium laxum]